MSARWNSALMLAVVGMVFIGASLILPWWGSYTEYESDYDGDKMVYDSGSGIPVSVFAFNSFYAIQANENTAGLFFACTFLMIFGLLFAAMQAAAIIQASNGNGGLKAPAIFGTISMIFCILAPVIFAAALPGAMEADAEQAEEDAGGEYESPDHDDPTKSFFGGYEEKEDDETERSEWGGDIGWIMAFLAFAMILMSMLVSLGAAKEDREVGPPRARRGAPPPARPFQEEGYRPPPSREELYGPPRRDPYGPPPGPPGYGAPPPPPPSYGGPPDGGYGRPPQYGY